MAVIEGPCPYDVWFRGVNVTGACTYIEFTRGIGWSSGYFTMKDEDGEERDYTQDFELTYVVEGKVITLYRAPLTGESK